MQGRAGEKEKEETLFTLQSTRGRRDTSDTVWTPGPPTILSSRKHFLFRDENKLGQSKNSCIIIVLKTFTKIGKSHENETASNSPRYSFVLNRISGQSVQSKQPLLSALSTDADRGGDSMQGPGPQEDPTGRRQSQLGHRHREQTGTRNEGPAARTVHRQPACLPSPHFLHCDRSHK